MPEGAKRTLSGMFLSQRHSRGDMIELERRAHAHLLYCASCYVLTDALRHLGQQGLGRRGKVRDGKDYMGRPFSGFTYR